MIKQWWKKISGIEKLELEAAKMLAESVAVKEAAEKKKQEDEIANKPPKQRATENKEPWVTVLNTHVNMENIRNGFFDLDWNEFFILQLRSNGYTGETDEEVVGQWFSELCRNIGTEEDINMEKRPSGYINVTPLMNGRTEVS